MPWARLFRLLRRLVEWLSPRSHLEHTLIRMNMLENKVGIIFGVANKRSIAWATAQALHEAGARLAFAYQGERLKESVESLTASEMPDSPLLSCDVTKQEEVDETFKRQIGRAHV